MAKPKAPKVPILRVKPDDSLRTIYTKAHRAFTAADLQKYTEPEDGVPANELLAELEAVDRRHATRQKKRPKHGRSG